MGKGDDKNDQQKNVKVINENIRPMTNDKGNVYRDERGDNSREED